MYGAYLYLLFIDAVHYLFHFSFSASVPTAYATSPHTTTK